MIVATASLKGKVQLANSAAADIANTGATGTANATVANADHVHKGVFSFAKSGGTAVFGAVTISGGLGITLTQTSNDTSIAMPALSSARVYVGSAGNVPVGVDVTGDVTITNAGVTAIGANKVTLAMMNTVATATFLGRTTAGTGNVEALTVTQATALLNTFGGDAGSGGVKGLVPATAIGDATKVLKGDATWGTTSDFAEATSAIFTIANGTKAIIGGSNLTIKANLTSAFVYVGNVSNVPVGVAISGDVTITNAGVVAIGANKVTLAMQATIATATFLGRTTAATGNVEALTVTQATALLNVFGADAGSGGVKGLVPATVAGDSAKFLKGNGTWAASSGGGGGGSLQWVEDTDSPVPVVTSGVRFYNFEAALTQPLWALIKVPTGYIAGTQIFLKTFTLSPDSSGSVLISSVATLIRAGITVMTATTNQRTSTNAAVTQSGATATIPQALSLDLTDASGQINGVAVAAGDLIKVKIFRGTDTATSDAQVPVYGAEVTTS